ncbi:hypothetical protein [Variovorax sp. EBFNA2]|uniref:hypothetical protein n=1 Tax=Variovorax sp. EBFNA2 TaxID=3342097 RepID=UPI0029C0468B|nr:hypothetical protein [Variovorax boronicumulans]WPG35327.1 hypothetical protein RZE79_17730 [Variovorax boronicumulans]
MTSIAHVASIALGAQRRLHVLSCAERQLRGQGQLSTAAAHGISAYRAVERSSLDVCAENLANLAPANDGAFTPTPEPELA